MNYNMHVEGRIDITDSDNSAIAEIKKRLDDESNPLFQLFELETFTPLGGGKVLCLKWTGYDRNPDVFDVLQQLNGLPGLYLDGQLYVSLPDDNIQYFIVPSMNNGSFRKVDAEIVPETDANGDYIFSETKEEIIASLKAIAQNNLGIEFNAELEYFKILNPRYFETPNYLTVESLAKLFLNYKKKDTRVVSDVSKIQETIRKDFNYDGVVFYEEELDNQVRFMYVSYK